MATIRLKQATDGWTLVDIRTGVALGHGTALKLSVENLTDETSPTHLNSLNPFTRQRINER